MIKAIRARVSAAFVAFITMSIVAMAFLSPTVSEARGGGFSGGGRSFSSARVYSAPRVYLAPRVIIAPRPVFIPRPVVVVRPMYTPRPVIVPFVQPTVVVPSDGYQQPVVVASGRVGHSFVFVLLILLLIILVIGGGGYYGYSYVGGMTPFDVDAIICADLAYEAFYDGGDFL